MKFSQLAILFRLVVGIALLGSLSACWNSDSEPKLEPVAPEKELYDSAMLKLKSNEFTSAIKDLEILESRYPYGRYSLQVQLELIYALHRTKQSISAKSAASRFIRLYPDYEHLDYVYYIKGLTAFEANQGLFDNYITSTKAKRDPGAMRESFDDFNTLLKQFPQSQYAADARTRMLYLRNLLAEHEIHVAKYYLSREAWLAAANRGQYVLENFQQTPSVKPALNIMITAYTKLGLETNAENARRVLMANYASEQTAIDQ